jgi:glutamine cyclotransferase
MSAGARSVSHPWGWHPKALISAALLAAAAVAQAALPVAGYAVLSTYPHDPDAFTQGLFYRDAVLYESTGLNGKSSIRKVDLQTGQVLSRRNLPTEFFGEGIAPAGDRLISLTWTNGVGFVFDLATLKPLGSFPYQGEGWGLTSDGNNLFMSNGTPTIKVLDPDSLKELRQIQVTANSAPVARLNELEWVDGEIFANVWQTNRIARIDPTTGHVKGWIDLTGLHKLAGLVSTPENVMNGIAWDSTNRRLFVTGKRWPKLFEIELTNRAANQQAQR